MWRPDRWKVVGAALLVLFVVSGCHKTKTTDPQLHLTFIQQSDLDEETTRVQVRIEAGKVVEMRAFGAGADEFQRVTPDGIWFNGEELAQSDSIGIYLVDLGNESIAGDSFSVQADFGMQTVRLNARHAALDLNSYDVASEYHVENSIVLSGNEDWRISQPWLSDPTGESETIWFERNSQTGDVSHQFQTDEAGNTYQLTIPLVSWINEYRVYCRIELDIVQSLSVSP